MRSPVIKTHLRWLGPLTNEQLRAMPGSRQGFTAQIVDQPGDIFSVALTFPETIADGDEQDVDLMLLAPEHIPDVVSRLTPGVQMRIFRGPKPVADCVVISVGHWAVAPAPLDYAACDARAITTVPATINAPPSQCDQVSRSPRNIAANAIATTTLSLSTGATCDALPRDNARK